MADVTIIPWYPSVAKPLDVWGSGGASSTLTHTPEARADILWDGDDATFIDSGEPAGVGWTGEWHADALAPSKPVPPGLPMWVRFHVRASARGDTAGGWYVSLIAFDDDGFYDRDLWGTGLGDLTEADGITSDTLTIHREGEFGRDGRDWHGYGEELDMFGRAYPFQVTIPEAGYPSAGLRWHEFWCEVAYERTTPLPLRQRQRDDGLNGAPRGRGGTSRQGSIRQRAYE